MVRARVDVGPGRASRRQALDDADAGEQEGRVADEPSTRLEQEVRLVERALGERRAQRGSDGFGVFLGRADEVAARSGAALRVALVGVAAAEVEQLGLPPEAVVQLRDARRDQPGGELERLGRRAEPAHVQVQPAEP